MTTRAPINERLQVTRQKIVRSAYSIALSQSACAMRGVARKAGDHSRRDKDVARLAPETVLCITPKKQGDDPQLGRSGAGGLRARPLRPFAVRIGKWNDVGKSHCTDGNRR